ncbi:MAG: thiamine-phosphate kinase, partial [Rubricoccaceae bacterium]|nr:thiamine-phosphate kinase [Rubricoccaceae bacterium]
MESDQSTFTPIAEVGEFGVIDRLRAVLGEPTSESVLMSIGDDAAVYRVGDGVAHVVTTDMLVEGVHFDRTYVPMRYLGWKSIAVNVSDIVAMNATPLYATVALGLPNNVSVEQLEALYAGMANACEAFGVAILGGDIAAAARLTISVTAVGEADEHDIIYRKGAQVDDLLCVTGDLGSAAAGFDILAAGKKGFEAGGNGASGSDGAQPDLQEFAYVVERQLYPQVRLDRIEHWADAGVKPTSLVDLSDGIGSDLHHICSSSGVGAVVESGL